MYVDYLNEVKSAPRMSTYEALAPCARGVTMIDRIKVKASNIGRLPKEKKEKKTIECAAGMIVRYWENDRGTTWNFYQQNSIEYCFSQEVEISKMSKKKKSKHLQLELNNSLMTQHSKRIWTF